MAEGTKKQAATGTSGVGLWVVSLVGGDEITEPYKSFLAVAGLLLVAWGFRHWLVSFCDRVVGWKGGRVILTIGGLLVVAAGGYATYRGLTGFKMHHAEGGRATPRINKSPSVDVMPEPSSVAAPTSHSSPATRAFHERMDAYVSEIAKPHRRSGTIAGLRRFSVQFGELGEITALCATDDELEHKERVFDSYTTNIYRWIYANMSGDFAAQKFRDPRPPRVGSGYDWRGSPDGVQKRDALLNRIYAAQDNIQDMIDKPTWDKPVN